MTRRWLRRSCYGLLAIAVAGSLSWWIAAGPLEPGSAAPDVLQLDGEHRPIGSSEVPARSLDVDPTTGARAGLAEYAAAWESRDVDRLSRVRSLDSRQRKAVNAYFSSPNSIEMKVEEKRVYGVNPGRVTIDFDQTLSAKGSKPAKTPYTARMEKRGERWVIAELNVRDARSDPAPAPRPDPTPDGPRHAPIVARRDRLLGGRDEMRAPPSPAHTRLERFPTLESPDVVPQGSEFELLVSLTVQKVTAHAVRTVLTFGKPEDGGWTLAVVLSAPGFRVRGDAARPISQATMDPNLASIGVRTKGDSTKARFLLTPLAGISEGEERTLRVNFFHEGAFLASAERVVKIASARAAVSESIARRRMTAASIHAVARPPQLTVMLTSERGGGRELILVSPFLVPPIRRYELPPAEDSGGFLRSSYGRLAALGPRGRTSADSPHAKARILAAARGLGRQVYEQFAPPPFREALWRLRDQLGSDFRAIQIVTDDPKVPWELMKPSREAADGPEEMNFLGIEFRLARWHVGSGGKQLDRPPQELPLDALHVIAPDYSDLERLPHQEAEVAALSQFEGFHRTASGLPGIGELLASDPSGIVHFSGHGTAANDEAGIARYAMKLTDGTLDLMTWRGLLPSRTRHHPFYFFNACWLGQAQRMAGFVEGWAPAVLDAGASGYLGSLWPVGDRGAAEFAIRFYGRLHAELESQGQVVVGDLLREVRAEFYQTGDPAYLAYAYYGDPQLRFSASSSVQARTD